MVPYIIFKPEAQILVSVLRQHKFLLHSHIICTLFQNTPLSFLDILYVGNISSQHTQSFKMALPPSILCLIEPGFLLYFAISAYVRVLFRELWQHGRIPPDLRGKAFGEFWTEVSGAPPDPSVPLAGSSALVPGLFAQARGVVLEVGPGSGNQAGYFNAAEGQIKRVYGAEPATELHQLIQKNVVGTPIGPKYTVISADATKASISSELIGAGLIKSVDDAEGIFDTILCIRVLCSVPNLERTITDLHALLRSGGTLLICEHTANPWKSSTGRILARLAQSLYMLLGWSYFVGDCSLTRHTEDMLRKDATRRWETIDIERHFGQAPLTYISGSLVKR